MASRLYVRLAANSLSVLLPLAKLPTSSNSAVIGTALRSTTEMSVSNANYVGGDIIGGASSPGQLLFRPRFALDPYFTGIKGTYLCSASTPPGAGAHGMCGANAASRALIELGTAATS
jgi:phytoene dehydrogenase-like protein